MLKWLQARFLIDAIRLDLFNQETADMLATSHDITYHVARIKAMDRQLLVYENKVGAGIFTYEGAST